MVSARYTNGMLFEVMLLAGKERFVAERLEERALSEEARQMVERLLRETGGFVEASALSGSDLVRAYGELRRLSTVAETALEKLSRVEEVARKGAVAPAHGRGANASRERWGP